MKPRAAITRSNRHLKMVIKVRGFKFGVLGLLVAVPPAFRVMYFLQATFTDFILFLTFLFYEYVRQGRKKT